jgi:hypothetical protein
MPIYTALPTTDKRSKHPMLKERGVAYRTTGPLNRMNIYGMVTEIEVAYSAYAHNIAVFLSATSFNRKIKVTANPSGHRQDLAKFDWAPTPPKVAFVARNCLPDEMQVRL